MPSKIILTGAPAKRRLGLSLLMPSHQPQPTWQAAEPSPATDLRPAHAFVESLDIHDRVVTNADIDS